MSSAPPEVPAVSAAPAEAVAGPALAGASRPSRALVITLVVLAAAGLLSSVLLWQKLSGIQEALARQSADSGAAAIEARAVAKQSQEQARDAASRVALLETRLNEVALQRAQLDELMQTLSRTRDDSLVVDIEADLRLAQQQALLTGTVEPLVASLRGAEQRLAKSPQPRLARLRAAVTRDLERVRSAKVTDVPGLMARLEELSRSLDELPLANQVPAGDGVAAAPRGAAPAPAWWQQPLQLIWSEARALVRVSRVDAPEAALISPEQGFFLRENLKLKLLNARLALMARQMDTARADTAAAGVALQKYFDGNSRRVQAAATALQAVQQQLRGGDLPRIDETFAALATAMPAR